MPTGWHNDAMPLDVNGDGQVSVNDAMQVVNYINAGGSRYLPPLGAAAPPAFLDVNHDHRATGRDALLVVQGLNRQVPRSYSLRPARNLTVAIKYLSEPVGIRLSSDASDRITATWIPAPGASGTVVTLLSGTTLRAARRLPPQSPQQVVAAPGGAFTFFNLRPNTRYFVRVAAIDEAGNQSRGIIQNVFTRWEEATNTHQLDRALTAGIEHLGNLRDRNNSSLPHFFAYSLTRAQAQEYGDHFPGRDDPAHLSHDRHYVSNVTARSLYAVLLAAQAAGIEPPADVVADYARILLRSLHKPRDGNWANTAAENQLLVGLVSDPASYGSQQFDVTYLFNSGQGFRGMLALATLMRSADQVIPEYGRSAKEIFETSVHNLRKYYVYDGEIGRNRVYDWEQFRQQLGLQGGAKIADSLAEELTPDWTNAWKTWADPHMIWPLVKYYEATGHQGSLDLAQELADMALSRRFPSDPSQISRSILPHMFETMAEMNAYSRLALVTNNAELMECVRLRYEYLRQQGLIGKTGWVPERLGVGRDIGEANNTAELIETALNFAEFGWTGYYQDVERFTRGHLLPAQLLNTSFIASDALNWIDGLRNVRQRLQGAFGFPAPYGHISTSGAYGRAGAYFADVSAGAVATIAEVQRQIYSSEDGNHRVNLLFDFENQRIRVASPYPGGDRLIVTTKVAGDLAVRIPQWADRALIAQAMNDQGLVARFDGDYLSIGQPAVNRGITIPMTLPRVLETDVINGRTIWIEWLGDSVSRMSGMGTPQPFFASF